MATEPDPQLLITSLLETAPIGIAVLDAECRYLHINALLAASNGLPAAAHIGQRPRDVLPDAGPGLETIMQAVLASNQARTRFAACAEIPPGSGKLRHWEASYHPLPGRDGQPAGIIAMVEDVTVRHEAERLQRENDATSAACWTTCSPLSAYSARTAPCTAPTVRRWKLPASA